MSNGKTPPPPSKSTAAPVEPTFKANQVAQQIRECITKIGESSPSSLRAIIDAYYGCLGGSAMAKNGSVGFPRTHRPHGSSPLRCLNGSRGDLICFAIANAILAYYGLVINKPLPDTLDRLRYLAHISANLGKDGVVSIGSDRTGYVLMTVGEYKARQQQAKNAEIAADIARSKEGEDVPDAAADEALGSVDA